MNADRIPVLALSFVIGLGAVLLSPTSAQDVSCGPDDRECLEDRYAAACAGSASAPAPCLAFARRIESHELADRPEWRLIAAVAYARMADLPGPAEEQSFRDRSETILRELLAEWPEGYYAGQAYIGLAGFAADDDETISLLRSAMAADPENTAAPYFLAGRLEARGENQDVLEAADLYRKTYSARGGFMSAAGNALRLYASIGQTEAHDTFRAQVAQDRGMDRYADDVRSADFAQDPERARDVLATACLVYVVAIFGSEVCADGIDSLAEASRTTSLETAREAVVDAAAEGIRLLRSAGWVAENRERDVRHDSILREWMDSGVATARVYVLWAQRPESGFDESLTALEKAVELAPDNGQYRYWLAHRYIQQYRLDEAIENLSIARDTLPENVGLTTDSVDRELRRAERLRASLSPGRTE